MSGAITVTNLRFTEASEAAKCGGLLGWVRFTLNDLVIIDGVTLRRTRNGRLMLSYPSRHDAKSRQHFLVKPAIPAVDHAIEAQVFATLGLTAGKSAAN